MRAVNWHTVKVFKRNKDGSSTLIAMDDKISSNNTLFKAKKNAERIIRENDGVLTDDHILWLNDKKAVVVNKEGDYLFDVYAVLERSRMDRYGNREY